MPIDDDATEEPKHPLWLIGGANFSTWPNLKYSRASLHHATLQARFAEWQAGMPVYVEGVLREDRLAIDFVARVPSGFPKQEWSLWIGDAIHNLRSSLDAVAWGMAHHNNAVPKRPKQVTFPVATEERQWKDAVKAWIGDIDPEFQRRIHVLQPYTYAPKGGSTTLTMLHELDIQDKHRDSLSVSIDLNVIDLRSSFRLEDPTAPIAPHLDMKNDVKFEDGVTVGTLHMGARIEPFDMLRLGPGVRVVIEHNGEHFDAMASLDTLFTETRRALDILMFGLEGDPPEPQPWTPVTPPGEA